MLLIVAGDKKEFATVKKVVDKFKMPEGKAVNIYPEFKLKKNGEIEVHSKEVKMSQLTMLISAPNYKIQSAISEDIAINCLGNGESSRLNKHLVLEDNIANATSSATMYMAKGGMHSIKITFPPENLSKVLARLLSVLENIKKEGLAKWEVDKIKNQYISSKIFEKESLESQAFNFGNGFIQFEKLDIEDQFIEKVRDASFDSVQKAFENIFGRELHLSLQVPKNFDLVEAKKELSLFKDQMKTFAQQFVSIKTPSYKIIKSKFDDELRVVKIKEGIELLYRRNKLTPTYVLHTYLRGGVSEENKKNNGTYNLLAQLLSQGYENVDREQIKKELDERSVSFGGFSGKNAYGLMMNGLTSNLTEVLPHYIGSLLNPQIAQKNFEQEKEFVNRALLQQTEDPVKQCFNKVAQLMFENHPYSLNTLGDFESIKNISNNDLLECHKNNLKNKKMLFTYCGHQELEEVLEMLAPCFERLEPRTHSKISLKKIASSSKSSEFISFDREQTHIFIGWPISPLGTKENIFIKMLSTYLSGQSSDLFVDVRDRKGLCYSVQPIYFSALEGGYWGIYMGTGNDKVEKAIVAILDLLNKIKEKGMSRSEFNKIKVVVEGQNQISIQTNEDYANIYSIPLLQNQGVDFYHHNNQIVQKMKYDEFTKLIKKFLARDVMQVVVGKK